MTTHPLSKIVFKFLFFVLLAISCLTPLAYAAKEDWAILDSAGNAFRSKFPKNQTEHFETFMIGPDHAAYAGENIATLMMGTDKKTPATYTIKVDQTLGYKILDKNLATLINQELQYYIDLYKDKSSTVHNLNKEVQFKNFGGGSVEISYLDPKKGQQTLKVRVLFTDVSKIRQLVDGSAESINSYETRDFFDSFTPYGGYAKIKNPDQNAWTDYTSPMKLFKISLPKDTTIFMPDLPEIHNKDKTERMSLRFADPLWNENIWMNIDGYVINKPVSHKEVMQLLEERYIQRHGALRTQNTCKQLLVDGISFIECNYSIKPLENYPYASRVRLKAQFFDRSVMVQEVISSENFIDTDFVNTTINKAEFLAGPPVKKKQAQ